MAKDGGAFLRGIQVFHCVEGVSQFTDPKVFAAGTRKIETGIAVFFKESEKYGLELDEHSVDRLARHSASQNRDSIQERN